MIIFYGLLGFVLGVPINALADALPMRRPVEWPAYLSGRGSLRPRDAAVHVAGAVLFTLLWAAYEREGVVQLALVSFYALVFLLVSVTDLEHRLIPDRAMLPAIVVAALASPVRFGGGWPYALVGGAFGFVFFYVAYQIGDRLFGSGALGFGDVKLATFAGLVSGFPQILVALVVGLFAGGAISLVLLLARRATLRTAIPYGPFIVVGGFYAMVWGADAIRWYAGQF